MRMQQRGCSSTGCNERKTLNRQVLCNCSRKESPCACNGADMKDPTWPGGGPAGWAPGQPDHKSRPAALAEMSKPKHETADKPCVRARVGARLTRTLTTSECLRRAVPIYNGTLGGIPTRRAQPGVKRAETQKTTVKH